MKNKTSIFIVFCLEMTASISAQTTFNELLSLVNAGEGNYFVRLYSYAETKETLVAARIIKDFIANIEIIETARDGGAKQRDKLKAYLDRLFTYTDMGQNKKLPTAYVSTRSSLNGGVQNKGMSISTFP